jgi:hypothetical protein
MPLAARTALRQKRSCARVVLVASAARHAASPRGGPSVHEKDSEHGPLAEYSEGVGMDTEDGERVVALERPLKHIFTSIFKTEMLPSGRPPGRLRAQASRE